MIMDLDPADALVASAELTRSAATARHRGINPPAALDRVAEQLRASALLAQYLDLSTADSGHQTGNEAPLPDQMVTVTTAADELKLSNRQVRRRCEMQSIPGARRVNPQTAGSPWLVPAAYIAIHRSNRRNP